MKPSLKIPAWIPMTAVLYLSSVAAAGVVEDDIKCLQGLKRSLDPLGRLSSWDFSNTSVASICKFVGVTCWSDRENRVLNLELRDMELTGSVPKDIEYCASLQSLDLGGNKLVGSIPPEICTWLPYLVTLNFSGNEFSGEIPPDLQHCKFLNNLILSDNMLTGSIPYEFSSLSRLKKFNVANNRLTGTIPPFLDHFDKADFTGNKGLSGGPLGSKRGALSKKSSAMIIAAGFSGAAASVLLSFGLWWWYHLRQGRP